MVMDLLHSDKLCMVLKSTPKGSHPESPSQSGTSTPTKPGSKFASISSLFRDSIANNGSQPGVELPAGKCRIRSHLWWPSSQTDLLGSYTCPCIFSLPKDAPPTIHLPSGARTYQLRAVIHRAGLLTPSVSRSIPFTVALLNDAGHSMANVPHEHKWKDSLLYAWRAGPQSAFVLGESIPLELTLVPLEKIFIHQVAVQIIRELTYWVNHSDFLTDPTTYLIEKSGILLSNGMIREF